MGAGRPSTRGSCEYEATGSTGTHGGTWSGGWLGWRVGPRVWGSESGGQGAVGAGAGSGTALPPLPSLYVDAVCDGTRTCEHPITYTGRIRAFG